MVCSWVIIMGFWDFFKNEKEVEKTETIGWGELENWLKNKISETDDRKRVFSKSMIGLINEFCVEIAVGIKSLQEINWDKIKVEEQVKITVKENLGHYISYLEKLKEDLENLGIEEVSRKRIELIFSNFNRAVRMNYQKSTFLIGKELGKIVKNIKTFFKSLDELQKENKDLIENIRLIALIKSHKVKIAENKKNISGILDIVSAKKNEISEIRQEVKEMIKKIEVIKNGKNYLAWKMKVKKLAEDKKSLEKELQMFGKLIDFKTLARTYHDIEKKMELVKFYRDDLRGAFEDDRIEEIIEMARNSGIDVVPAEKSLIKIKDLEKETKSVKLNRSPTFDLEMDIKKSYEVINRLEEEKEKEARRIEGLGMENKRIFDKIKNELGLAGVIVKD